MVDDQSTRVSVETISAVGAGESYPRKGQMVTVHYTAFYMIPIDAEEEDTGKRTKEDPKLNQNRRIEFDSTYVRNKPFRYKVFAEQVIPGLDEGVSQLCAGERALIRIPADRGYGDAGFPGLIPPKCDLIFDLELLEVCW